MLAESDIRMIVSEHLTALELSELSGASVLDPNILDEVILGSTLNSCNERILVYSYDKLVEILARDLGTDPEDKASALEQAEEWISYNTVRALLYMGSRAPLLLSPLEDQLSDDADLTDQEAVDFQGKKWLKQS